MSPNPKKTIADHVIDLLTSQRGGWRPGELHAALSAAGNASPSTGLSNILRGLLAQGRAIKSDKGVYTLPDDAPTDQRAAASGGVKTAADRIIDLITSRPGGWGHGELHMALVQAGHIRVTTGINTILSGLVASGRISKMARGVYGLPDETYVPKPRSVEPGMKRISDHIVDLISSRRGGWSHGELLDRLNRDGRLSASTGITSHLKGLVAQGVLEHEDRGMYRLANEKPVVPAYDRPVESIEAAVARDWPIDLTQAERSAFALMVSQARQVGNEHRIVRLRDRLSTLFEDEDTLDGFIAEAAARQLLAFVSDTPHEIHRVDPARINALFV